MKNVFKKVLNTTVLVIDWKGEKYYSRYEVAADMKEIEDAYAGSDLVSEAKQRAKEMTVAEALMGRCRPGSTAPSRDANNSKTMC